ncbi:hypothetical protein [Pontibacillus sp. HMF3514]|uniref:hypothetical protein n=1 Tax=Pontibacillus sp. HMF3514 TaxID=2692425 RepID=UPI00131FD6DF|nr:hypothetical protein [Pontibacillus sp. HMF3514]QHE53726.1 hypothetical protein GS400_17645 [Pontibacillus sp. HMF3514]
MDLEKFLKFEKDMDLFTDEINGVRYWHIIRKYVYDEIQKDKDGVGTPHTTLENRGLLYRALLKVKQIPNILFNSPIFLKEKDILILNHHRRVKKENLYECIYTDEIIRHINHSYLVLEDPLLDMHYRPIPPTNIRYTDNIYNRYVFKRIINSLFKLSFVAKTEKENFLKLINKINIEFNVNLSQQYMLRLLENNLLQYQVIYKQFNKIINKVKPKIILEVVSYGLSRYAINDIAKRKGIPTVELQHGTMGKYHVSYNFAQKMNLYTFPEYLFLFGDYWKYNTNFPIDDTKVRVVGWPSYEENVKLFNKRINKRNKKRVILFISQGTIGKELSKIALELSKIINLDNYEIIYKLHPGEYARWKIEYPWLETSNDIQVIDNNKREMHYYFSKSDIQVGVYSTALYEGLGYGLETYVCKIFGYKNMEELYNNNYVNLVESADDLSLYINKLNYYKAQYDTSYFWKDNSLDNIVKEVGAIISKT